MPQALAVDWNEVKTLAIALGVREAARRLGLNEDSVKNRCFREGWLKEKERTDALISQHVADKRMEMGLNPVQPKAADILSSLKDNSKLGFAKAAEKVAMKLAETDVDELLVQGQTAVQWVKVAATVHGFGGDGAVSLRLELIARGHGSAADEPGATLDAEVEITRPDGDSDDL